MKISDDEFIKNVFEFKFTKKRLNIAKYILLATAEVDDVAMYNDELVNVEHIAPKNSNKEWLNYLEVNQVEYKQYSQKIGNLILMESKLNQLADRSSFAEKKKLFLESNLINSFFEILLLDEWNIDMIDARSHILAEDFVNLAKIANSKDLIIDEKAMTDFEYLSHEKKISGDWGAFISRFVIKNLDTDKFNLNRENTNVESDSDQSKNKDFSSNNFQREIENFGDSKNIQNDSNLVINKVKKKVNSLKDVNIDDVIPIDTVIKIQINENNEIVGKGGINPSGTISIYEGTKIFNNFENKSRTFSGRPLNDIIRNCLKKTDYGYDVVKLFRFKSFDDFHWFTNCGRSEDVYWTDEASALINDDYINKYNTLIKKSSVKNKPKK